MWRNRKHHNQTVVTFAASAHIPNIIHSQCRSPQRHNSCQNYVLFKSRPHRRADTKIHPPPPAELCTWQKATNLTLWLHYKPDVFRLEEPRRRLEVARSFSQEPHCAVSSRRLRACRCQRWKINQLQRHLFGTRMNHLRRYQCLLGRIWRGGSKIFVSLLSKRCTTARSFHWRCWIYRVDLKNLDILEIERLLDFFGTIFCSLRWNCSKSRFRSQKVGTFKGLKCSNCTLFYKISTGKGLQKGAQPSHPVICQFTFHLFVIPREHICVYVRKRVLMCVCVYLVGKASFHFPRLQQPASASEQCQN